MRQLKRKMVSLMLAFAMLAAYLPMGADNYANVKAASADPSSAKLAGDYLAKQAASDEAFGAISNYDMVTTLAKYGTVPEKVKSAFVASAEASIKAASGNASVKLVIALECLGEDVTNFAGYNLLKNFYDADTLINAGWSIYSIPYYIQALSYKNYSLDKVSGDATALDMYVNYLLKTQKANGSWSDDTEITSMVLQGFAYMTSDSAVKAAYNKGLNYLAYKLDANGGIVSYGLKNVNSNAMLLLALTYGGVAADNADFVKNGVSVADVINACQLADGSYGYVDNSEYNYYATVQAVDAILASNKGGYANIYCKDEAVLKINEDEAKALASAEAAAKASADAAAKASADAAAKASADAAAQVKLANQKKAISAVKAAKISGLKVTCKKKKVTIKFNKQSKVTNYQIQVSTVKTFKKSKTKTYTTAKKSYMIKGLTLKKTYYIRVRGYKKLGLTTNSKTTYSNYYTSYTAKKKIKIVK